MGRSHTHADAMCAAETFAHPFLTPCLLAPSPLCGRCVVLYPLCKESLAGRLASSASGGYDLPKALTWLFQMAHGLRDLMRAATIHGDLHPGNVLLNEHDQVSGAGRCEGEELLF